MKRSTCEWPLLYQRTHYPSDESMAVLKLWTHLFIRLDERSGANICSSPGCARVSRQYKDGHKTHYASGRTFLLLERRTTKGTFVWTHNAFCARLYTRGLQKQTNDKIVCPSSSRRTMRPQPHKSGQWVVQHVLPVCFRRIERRREDGLRAKRPFSHTANLTRSK